MLDWIINTIDALGYWGIVGLMILENVFPPIPSEVIIPLSGFASSQSDLHLFAVIMAGSIGSVVGTLPWYFLGRFVRQEVLEHWVSRHGHWFALSVKDIHKATTWFRKRQGYWALILSRMVPGIRTYISVPAGISAVPILPYFVFSLLGTAVWVSGLAIAGYLLGEQFGQVKTVLGPVSTIVFIGLMLAGIVWVLSRRFRQTRS